MSWEADDTSVRVALRIRPQLANEKIDMCRTCTHVPPGEAMVTLGKDKSFTYDYVFDTNSHQERIYEACIQPLIEGCFEGYNATVLAYGQTGAGKTYTMGTGFDVSISAEEQGVIPRAVEHLFQGIGERRKAALERGDPPPEFKINAQFMELYNEDIIDLFDPSKEHGKKSHIKIHEDATGGIYTVGVTTRAVSSKEEIIQCLKMGALSRTTASTNMNAQSSRSHAIFTIHIKQQRVVRGSAPVGEEEKDDTDKETDTAALNDFETLTAKFHFVDLAGSERLKRTGATGDRQKEGISINCGLLALGNVISALGDPKKKGSHVPYRDSKLTRLLQDSLGGNSRTLMIACVSPSDRDFMETLNTLKYANRARNIKNKVSVNQDKTSKIIQELRAKVMELETELLEYRQGRRTIGEDGVECINDMFHENTMLQTENNQLRMRIKAIQETVESQAARISQLMTDQARWQIHQAGEDGEDQVGSMIQGYMKEIEELRGKLIESESMVTHLQRRLSNQGLALSTSLSSRSPSHIALTGGLDSSDLTNQFGGGSPVSPIAEDTESIISLAKKDLQNLKHKKNRVRKRHNSESSDKENRSDGEEDQEEEGEKNGMGEESEEEEDDEEDENQEEKEEGEEEEDSSESSSDEEEDDNLEEDLADISCEIAIKQKLIDELEVSQKKMQVLKFQYEEKLMTLHQKIQATQQERDKVLANMESVDHIAEEKAKKVKSEYERKLKHMQDEVKKLQAAKREHARLMRNNAQYEKQLKTLRHDLDEMKKTKVRLMKQMRDEQAKSRESENKRSRELAQLKKEQRRRDNVIQQLEREKKQRELVLKRKQEEVNSLRKQARPVSGKVGDYRKKTTTNPPSTNGHAEEKPELAPKPRPRTAPSARTAASSSKSSQSKPSSSAIEKPGAIRGSHIPAPTSTPRRVKHQRRQSSEKMAKMKWQSLEKRVGEVIARRQTINHMERDMERWLQEREKLGKRIERIKQKRNKAVEESKDPKALQELQDQITVLTDNIDNVNDNIMESQNSIMQMSEEGDPVDITAVINSCSIEEARYLLEHFLNMVITKGMYAAQKETECKEREAKVHTLEHSYNMTQDLLQHLIQGQAEYDPELEEVLGNSMAAVAPSNSSSAASTRSASPVDEAEDKVTDLAEIGSRLAAMEAQQKKEKARRRTATPSDLLFADSSDSSSDIASCDIVKPSPTTLIPLAEQKDESSNQENVDVVDAAKLMPPPPAPPSKPPVSSQSTSGLRRSKSGSSLPTTQVNSASDKRSTTPSMRRKTYTKPPAPISMSRTNSTSDTGSDMTITPPGSPTSQRPSGQNVFARLSAPSNSPHKLDKGSINPYNSRSSSRSSPLTCMHLAEGHTKAVLSVDATDDLLFSASKDRTVKVWNLVTGQEIMTLPGHPNNVVGVRYCSYTGLVFSVSTYFVKVWDIRSSSAKCVKTLTSAGQVVTSAASSTTTRTLSMPAGETQINDIRLNRSGSRLYAAAGNTIRVWDLNKFQTVGKLTGGHSAAVMVMATEDQEHDTPIVVSGSKDHYIKVFEVPENLTGSVSAKYNLEPPHYDGIQSLAIRGDFLFSGSRDTCIKKWDLANQQLRQWGSVCVKDWSGDLTKLPTQVAGRAASPEKPRGTLVDSISNAHKDWVCALDFVPGRQMLLSGCRAGQLKVWQMEDCSLVGEVKGHDSPINAICSNSSHIFTASSDRNVRIWRPQTTLDGQNSDNTDTNDEGHASI